MTAMLPAAIGIAIVCMFIVATFMSRAGRLVTPLRRFQGEMVGIQVWGAALPVPPGLSLQLVSVRAIGAGLHLFLRVGSESEHLKIAQPGAARFHEHGVEIDDARSIQWRGKRLQRTPGSPALQLLIA
jgi:hypothetical protein